MSKALEVTANGGLALTRKKGQSVFIGDDIRITIGKRTTGGQVVLMVKAPRGISILREEVYVRENGQEAADKVGEG